MKPEKEAEKVFGFCPSCGHIDVMTDAYTICSRCNNLLAEISGSNTDSNIVTYQLVSKLYNLGVVVSRYYAFADKGRSIITNNYGFKFVFERANKYEFIAKDKETFDRLRRAINMIHETDNKIRFNFDEENNRAIAINNRCENQYAFESHMGTIIMPFMAAVYVIMSDIIDAPKEYNYSMPYAFFCTKCGHIHYSELSTDSKCEKCDNEYMAKYYNNPTIDTILKEYFKLGYIITSFFDDFTIVQDINHFRHPIRLDKNILYQDEDHFTAFIAAAKILDYDKYKAAVRYPCKCLMVVPVPWTELCGSIRISETDARFKNTCTKYLIDFYTKLLPILKKHLGIESDAK